MVKQMIPAAVAGLMALSAAPALAESEWKYSLGTDISSGDYGDVAETEIVTTPFTVSYKPSSRWTFKASLPFTSIEGPGGVVPTGDGGFVIGGNGNGNPNRPGMGNPGEQETEVTSFSESGLGDLWLTGSYSLEPIGERWFVDLSAKYKLPVADETRGLGTGEADYTLQADVFTAMGDFTPFATVARKFKGDTDERVINDVWYTSLGSAYRINTDSSVGLSLDYQQATSDTSDDATELFGYFNQKLSARWSGMVYAYLGLTDGSPDQGFGVQVSYRPGQ